MDITELVENLKAEFPKYAIDIKESIELLKSCLEDTIDSIEDKSYRIIRVDRDYNKGDEYRQLSRELYDISVKLQDYIEKLDLETTEEEDNEIDYTIENIEKDKPDEAPYYIEYTADTNIEHTLYEDFTYKRPYAFKLEDAKVLVNDWRGMFLKTADMLAVRNKEIISTFPNKPEMNGKRLVYFSFHKNSKMSSPRKLKNVDMYVSTQLGINGMRNLIVKMLQQYGIPIANYKVYLAADYSEID